jgi:hypothetical protein
MSCCQQQQHAVWPAEWIWQCTYTMLVVIKHQSAAEAGMLWVRCHGVDCSLQHGTCNPQTPASVLLAAYHERSGIVAGLTILLAANHCATSTKLTGREPGTGGMPSSSSWCAAAGMPAASASCPCCACTHTSTPVHRKNGTKQLAWLCQTMMIHPACVSGTGINQWRSMVEGVTVLLLAVPH